MAKLMTRLKPSLSRRLLGAVFFIYSMFWFLISTIFIALICWIYNRFVPNKMSRAKFFHTLSYCWIKFLLGITFAKAKVRHHYMINKNQAHIYISNHRSFLDIWLTTPLLPQANITIGKDSFAKVPIFGIIYKMGSVLVNREKANSRLQSFIDLQKCLEQNMSVCIYPEGKRNQTSEYLLPFHNGAFKLSKLNNVPIVLVAIMNTQQVLPPDIPFYFFPKKVEMHILECVFPQQYETEVALREACYQKIHFFLEQQSHLS